MTSRAAVYLRQSKDRTGDALAIDRQRSDCLRLCADRGWTVVGEFVDNDISATSDKRRPAYESMITSAEGGSVDVIVAWHVDRLTRKLTELESLIGLSERTGVKVATVSGDIDLTTDAGRLVGRILASVARGEVERKSARQKAATRQRAESGLPPTRRAFGYTPDGMSIFEPEASAVRQAYAQLLAGASLVAVTNAINAEGLLSTRGHIWQRPMVRAMLLNARYAGIRTMHRKELTAGTWPALVPEETYRAAAALLADPVRISNKVGTARKWIGGGLYVCGLCDSDMRIGYRKEGARIYLCRRASHLSRSAPPVDEYVEQVICARLQREDTMQLLTGRGEGRAAPLRVEAQALRLRADQIAADYGDDLLTGRQVFVATQKVVARLEVVEAELAAAAGSSGMASIVSSSDPGAAFRAAHVGVRRAVVDALTVVTLLKSPPGRAPFDVSSVHIAWREL